jgi:hypothetical protein
VRASDRDRDAVAERLRESAAEGRIDFDELDQRLTEVYQAKTYAALEPVTRDLPEQKRGGARVQPGAEPGRRFALGTFGLAVRRGGWVVPRVFSSVSMFGGGVIDLSQARLSSPSR